MRMIENERNEKERLKQEQLLFLKSKIDKQIKANSLLSKNKMQQISCKQMDDKNKLNQSQQNIENSQMSNSFSYSPNKKEHHSANTGKEL